MLAETPYKTLFEVVEFMLRLAEVQTPYSVRSLELLLVKVTTRGTARCREHL